MSELTVKPAVDATRNATNLVAHLAERRLMEAIESGDQNALKQLVHQFGNKLALFIGRLMVWHDDCDDIFQNVLLIAWQRAGQYNGEGPLEAWLKRIAINQCRNHFRAINVIRRKLHQVGQRLIGETTNSTSTYSIAEHGAQVKDEGLASALNQLSQQDRMAVVLFYLEGYSGKEVAEQLGIKTDALHVRLHRIKKRLKHSMESQ